MKTSARLAFLLLLGATTAFAGNNRPDLRVPKPAAPGRVRPLRNIAGLLRPKREQAIRLANARVVLADYPLVRHDFGEAIATKLGKSLDQVTNDEIDRWLLDSAAFIATSQTRQTDVNTPIPTAEHVVEAYRPHDYGRALVMRPAPNVLIDVKGAGAKSPTQTDHANGLATLGEVVREFAYEQLVHRLFEHARTGQRTVGHYAVIDAGFDVKWGDGKSDLAGLILRQAHVRAPGDKSSFNKRDSLAVERTLRRYGVTSAGAYQNEPYDSLNVQGTHERAVIDFGGFLTMPDFTKPAYHIDYPPENSVHNKPSLSPDKEFVHPDATVRVPVAQWGYSVTGKADPVADNPWVWSHDLARALRDGRATRKDAEQHLHNLLDPVEAQLK